MERQQPFSWKARARSFRYAAKGITTLFRCEHNARIHLAVTFAVIIAGLLLNLDIWQWAVVSLCIGSVLGAEAVNSAVEAVCDKISPAHDPLIGKAKDLAAAAVLLVVTGAVAAGLLIFIPKITALL